MALGPTEHQERALEYLLKYYATQKELPPDSWWNTAVSDVFCIIPPPPGISSTVTAVFLI